MPIQHKVVFRDTHAELIEAPLAPIADDQVLIRTRCSLISPGTERAALIRLWDDPFFRENPGYQLAGDVIEVGRSVANLAVGDRVITLMNHSDLSIAPASPSLTHKIPEGLSYETACFCVLASVALHAVRRARIELGDNFVVFGAGIIGLFAIQLARLNGARRVIALDLAPNRLELAHRLGADLALDPTDSKTADQIRRAMDGKGPSVILEATGNPRAVVQAFKLAAPGARVVCVGILEEPISISLHKDFVMKELSLIAAFQPFCPTVDNIYWHWTQQANREMLLDLMASGKLRTDGLLTDRFTPDRVPEAYEHIRQAETDMLGVLFEWS